MGVHCVYALEYSQDQYFDLLLSTVRITLIVHRVVLIVFTLETFKHVGTFGKAIAIK